MKMPVVTVKRIHHRGAVQLALFFPYDRDLLKHVRRLPGIRWSQTHKCWYLPDTKENFKVLFRVFKDVAWLDISHLRPEGKSKRRSTSRTARSSPLERYKGRLTSRDKEHIEKMVRKLHSLGYSQRTVAVYRYMIEVFLGYLEKEAEEMTEEDIRDFQYQFWVKNHYAPATQRQFIGALKHLISVLPGCKVEPEALVLPKKERSLPKVLSYEEITRMLASVKNLKHFVILGLLYSSGLRVGELVALKIEDIDFDRMQIHIRSAKGKKDRYVGLSRYLLPVLRSYLYKYHPKDYLLNGLYGGQYTESSIRKVVEKAANEAGIKKRVTPHMLRHSYATHLLERGVDIRHIQELLGHSKPETTMIYTHVTTRQLTEIKSPLDALVESSSPDKKNISPPKFLLSGNDPDIL